MVDKYGEAHPVDDGTKVTMATESTLMEVSGGLFNKMWADSGIEKLEDAEIGFLVKIIRYVRATDNTIRLKDEVMTVKEMAKVTGKEYTRLSRLVSELIEKKVMGKHSTEIVEYSGRRKTVYTVNPYILCKSKMVNKRVVEYYKPH